MLDARTIELAPLISPMIKLLASHSAIIKKLSCDFLIRASEEQPDVGLLAVNVLHLDLRDPNPDVRATAVATICSLPILAESNSVEGMKYSRLDRAFIVEQMSK